VYQPPEPEQPPRQGGQDGGAPEAAAAAGPRPVLMLQLLLREGAQGGPAATAALELAPRKEAFLEALAALQRRLLAAAQGVPRLVLDSSLQAFLEAPPEGLATDPDWPPPGMLGPDADALGRRVAAALGAALRGARRHASGLGHLAGFVAAGHGVSKDALAARVRDGTLGLEDLRRCGGDGRRRAGGVPSGGRSAGLSWGSA
jgi:hypothetical protein